MITCDNTTQPKTGVPVPIEWTTKDVYEFSKFSETNLDFPYYLTPLKTDFKSKEELI